MKTFLVLASILLVAIAAPIYALELREVVSSEQLARFIYQMATEDVPVSSLLNGIESKETLRIPGYGVEIPVREIFGTIISERYGDKIDRRLFESSKKYEVREICAFRDSKDQIWRFHITIFEDNQYKIMKEFLKGQTITEKRK
jgi:hypothetical protein